MKSEKYREDTKQFCCEKMQNEIKNNEQKQSVIKYDNTAVLENKYGTGNFIMANDKINNCPWCGQKLNW